MRHKKGQVLLGIAVFTLFMGIVIMVGFLVVDGLKQKEITTIEVNGTLITNRTEYNTTQINYSTYGKELNKNYDSLYDLNIDLDLENI